MRAAKGFITMQETNLDKEINSYWSKRAASYSEVNQTELQGRQHGAWQELIIKTIEKAHLLKAMEQVRSTDARKDISVLDIGTGPGFFAIILAEAGFKVTALDANENMLEQARINAGSLGGNITFLQGDAQELPFEAESFDVVISRNLTWVLPQPEFAYKDWCRVLKHHGLLINFDANWYNYLYDDVLKAAFEQDRLKVAEHNFEDHYLTTDMDAMERIALQVPLSAIQRPTWDIKVLQNCGMKHIVINNDINDSVLSEVERVNYASTPYFMVTAVKE